MKRLSCVLLLAMLATGCEKKKDAQPGASNIPGGGTTVMTKYNGPVTSNSQDVPTNADVINHPNDAVYVYLCRGVDCTVDTLPAAQCTAIYPDVTTPCYRTTPAPNFVYAENFVRFLYGQSNGFQSYAIETIVTR